LFSTVQFRNSGCNGELLACKASLAAALRCSPGHPVEALEREQTKATPNVISGMHENRHRHRERVHFVAGAEIQFSSNSKEICNSIQVTELQIRCASLLPVLVHCTLTLILNSDLVGVGLSRAVTRRWALRRRQQTDQRCLPTLSMHE
jgi:hypothetical protein